MPEKQMKPPCNNCRLKCSSNISQDEQQQLSAYFCTLSHMKGKNMLYVCSNVPERTTRTYLDENERAQQRKDVSSDLQLRKWLAS